MGKGQGKGKCNCCRTDVYKSDEAKRGACCAHAVWCSEGTGIILKSCPGWYLCWAFNGCLGCCCCFTLFCSSIAGTLAGSIPACCVKNAKGLFQMAWICLSLVLYRVILTIIIVVEVVKLNDEISNYRDCCADKGGCSKYFVNDDEDASSEEKNQRKCIDHLSVRVDTIGEAESWRDLGVYAAVVVGLYILVSLIGAQQALTASRAELEKENEVESSVGFPVIAGSQGISNMEAQTVVPGVVMGRVGSTVAGSTVATGVIVGRVQLQQGQVQQMQPQGEFDEEMSVPNATPVKY